MEKCREMLNNELDEDGLLTRAKGALELQRLGDNNKQVEAIIAEYCTSSKDDVLVHRWHQPDFEPNLQLYRMLDTTARTLLLFLPDMLLNDENDIIVNVLHNLTKAYRQGENNENTRL